MVLTLPNTIKIGGMVWKVEAHAGVALEGNVHGSTHYSSQTIYLDPANTPQYMLETLLHEVLHVLFRYSALHQAIDKLDDKLNEQIVTMLGYGLHQVLVGNGWLALKGVK